MLNADIKSLKGGYMHQSIPGRQAAICDGGGKLAKSGAFLILMLLANLCRIGISGGFACVCSTWCRYV